MNVIIINNVKGYILMKTLSLRPTKAVLRDTFENDYLERNKDICQFIQLLDAIEDDCTVAIDAQWGAGKTFFVKHSQLVLEALNPQCEMPDDERRIIKAICSKNGIKTEDAQPQVAVYYDAWTHDAEEEPVLSLIYEIMLQLGIDFTWQWHSNRHTLNEFTPFRLVYSKLLSTTQAMDEIMSMNPVVKNSFNNTYIPSMGYSFTYTNDFGRNSITCNIDAKEAGNVFAGIWEMCGSKNDKKLFGTPFSQFFKIQTQLVWKFSFTQSSQLVSRLLVGAAHAYGNSAEVPYSEQFYSGGANSVRAFTIRSIGPGSYRASEEDNFGYYDQTGTFKFENNWEYRFPILGYLHGAIFLDAGNVWLLKNDPEREGGKLTMKKFFDQLAVGTGLGLRFDMSMIVVRADLGIGIHAPYDTGKSGYYNIAKFKDGLAFHLAIGYPF